ncbi:MAG: tRNA pseudouridine synthase A [Thermoplasmatota archaeon]
MRLALKFGYDGRSYAGFARQPDRRTVEGEILDALRDLRLLAPSAPPREIGYGAASRTDAGVSAVGNVIALNTSFRREALLPALNARLSDIWLHSWAEVPASFQPQRARLRWYRYHVAPGEAGDPVALGRALEVFVGRHDFRSFCRPEGRSAVRTIRRIRLRRGGSHPTIDFFAQSFLWGQVRRVVGASLAVSRGELSLSELRAALEGPERRAGFRPAPPEGLVLMDVDYGFDFTMDARAVELVRRRLEGRVREAEGTLLLASYLSALPAVAPPRARRR